MFFDLQFDYTNIIEKLLSHWYYSFLNVCLVNEDIFHRLTFDNKYGRTEFN